MSHSRITKSYALNLISAAGLVAFAGIAEPAAGEVFDAVTGFTGVQNPNFIWSYGYSLDGVTAGPVPLPFYGFDNNDPTSKISNGTSIHSWKVWRQPAFNGNIDIFLGIGANKTALDFSNLSSSLVIYPARHIIMHPPASGSVIITFTAPRAMSGAVHYNFTHLDCHGGVGINFIVQQVRPSQSPSLIATLGQGSEWSTSCSALASSGNLHAPVALKQGDQVNFIVRPNADGTNFYDTTGLAASIVAH